jgi:hypothetical protein
MSPPAPPPRSRLFTTTLNVLVPPFASRPPHLYYFVAGGRFNAPHILLFDLQAFFHCFYFFFLLAFRLASLYTGKSCRCRCVGWHGMLWIFKSDFTCFALLCFALLSCLLCMYGFVGGEMMGKGRSHWVLGFFFFHFSFCDFSFFFVACCRLVLFF